MKKELTELEQMKENSQLDRNILEYYYDKDVSETKAIMFKLEERALDVYARKKDLYM